MPVNILVSLLISHLLINGRKNYSCCPQLIRIWTCSSSLHRSTVFYLPPWWPTLFTGLIYLSCNLSRNVIQKGIQPNPIWDAQTGITTDPWWISPGKLWQPCLPMCHVAAAAEVNRSWHLSQMLELASELAHISEAICHMSFGWSKQTKWCHFCCVQRGWHPGAWLSG